MYTKENQPTPEELQLAMQRMTADIEFVPSSYSGSREELPNDIRLAVFENMLGDGI